MRHYIYRDFGTLVSLGESATVGNLMGLVSGWNLFVAGQIAHLMYRSLHKMHELALHGPGKVVLDTCARMLTRRSEPQIKLH
jgi:NADH:ubiquinone reductase (H+-translocating)